MALFIFLKSSNQVNIFTFQIILKFDKLRHFYVPYLWTIMIHHLWTNINFSMNYLTMMMI